MPGSDIRMLIVYLTEFGTLLLKGGHYGWRYRHKPVPGHLIPMQQRDHQFARRAKLLSPANLLLSPIGRVSRVGWFGVAATIAIPRRPRCEEGR
jgi:hypothetical protein